MTTFDRPDTPAPPKQVRIGLWGPPASGKTTFLAALYIANMRADLPGDWIMSGADANATQFLQEAMLALTEEKVFPSGTFDPKGMIFRFTGQQEVVRRNRFGKRIATMEKVAFELDVLDVPGTLYANPLKTAGRDDPGESDDLHVAGAGRPAERAMDPVSVHDERLLDHLQMCDGIVYLYDPERDAKKGDAFQYFYPVLEQLTSRVLGQRTFSGSKLPQHVAVCVTKFDMPDIYRTAQLRGYTVTDPYPPYLPKIQNEMAVHFFQELAESPTSNTDLVARGLKRHFDTIGYFITSSIGFYVSEGRFRSHDSMNLQRTGPTPGDIRIRGKVYPINVLEPLLWLHKSITGR